MIGRANPVAKMFAALILPVAAMITFDPVTPGVILGGELIGLSALGLPWSGVWRRSLLVLGAAVPAAGVAWLYGTPHEAAVAALRILAGGLPGVLMLATIDPSELADGLAQVLRLPGRFVISALAAIRLIGDLIEEWQDIRMARRARGIDPGVGPLARLSALPGLAFTLIVLALRRAVVLAGAMEARGLGRATHRTWARESVLGSMDWLLVSAAMLLAALATTISIACGAWHFVWL